MSQTVGGTPCMNDEFKIRILRESDLAKVDELVQQAGWNQLHTDWQRVLQYEPDGCFAAFINDRLVGTVTTTTYGKSLGWIGMMLVHTDFRRRGIATALMRQALAYLDDCRVVCIKLDATPEGQFVYEQLGFAAEWRFHRWERAPDLPSQSVPLNQVESVERFSQLDCTAFGANRSRWLKLLQKDSYTICTGDGFGMTRSGRRATYLGPVTAATPPIAEQIIRKLVENSAGRIFWDIPGDNHFAQSLASELGFSPVRDLTRMLRGQPAEVPNIAMQYAIAGPETG